MNDVRPRHHDTFQQSHRTEQQHAENAQPNEIVLDAAAGAEKAWYSGLMNLVA